MNPTRKAFLVNTFGIAEFEAESFVEKLKASLFGEHDTPAAASVDLKPIEDRLAALEQKIGDLEPTGADVETMKAEIATLKDEAGKTADHIALLTSEIDGLTSPDAASGTAAQGQSGETPAPQPAEATNDTALAG